MTVVLAAVAAAGLSSSSSEAKPEPWIRFLWLTWSFRLTPATSSRCALPQVRMYWALGSAFNMRVRYRLTKLTVWEAVKVAGLNIVEGLAENSLADNRL